jgi:hypothetical protein
MKTVRPLSRQLTIADPDRLTRHEVVVEGQLFVAGAASEQR